MESHQSQTWWNPSSSPWQCQGRSSHWLWQGGQGSGPCGHHESQGRARLWGPPGRVTHGTACTETMHCQGYPPLLCTIHIKFRSPTHSLVWNRNKGDLKKQFSLNIWAKTCTARAEWLQPVPSPVHPGKEHTLQLIPKDVQPIQK